MRSVEMGFVIKSLIATTCAMVLLVTACGEDDPIELAWDKFISGNYAGALTDFADLVDTHGSEAYVGMGWSSMKLSQEPGNVNNSDDLVDDADEFFELASGDSLIHGFAGWVIASWQREDWDGLLERADFVLQEDSRFVFIRDRTVDFGTIIFHQASAYFHLGDLDASLERIQELDPEFNPDLNNPNITTIFTDKLAELSDLVAL